MISLPRRTLAGCSGALLAGLALSLSLLGATAPVAAASGGAAPCYGSGSFPVFAGTPPWGYRTGGSLSPGSESGSFARAYGDINLASGTISGQICQVDIEHGTVAQILLAPVSPILFHSHTAQMWGYPGNEIRTDVRVTASDDPSCVVGTVGLMTMYASYDNVRSDSIQFSFPAACRSHDQLYHGAQVNAQVPPL